MKNLVSLTKGFQIPYKIVIRNSKSVEKVVFPSLPRKRESRFSRRYWIPAGVYPVLDTG